MNQIKEIYEYREMIISLVRKDLRGRYKGSVLGFFWTFLNPLLQLVVFTLVFSIIMKQEYEQYYIFLFVALVPWMFFASSVQDGSTSVLRDKEMVKKIYFPREVLPIATVTSGFVNMLLTFLVIFVVLIFSGRGVNPVALLCLPVVMIVEYILCLGVGLIVASVTVYLRDCLLYTSIPAAAGIIMGRALGLSFFHTFMLSKMVILFTYVLVMYFAIKKLKNGKILLAVIGLSSTTMFMASTMLSLIHI